MSRFLVFFSEMPGGVESRGSDFVLHPTLDAAMDAAETDRALENEYASIVEVPDDGPRCRTVAKGERTWLWTSLGRADPTPWIWREVEP